jgi:hypothetical protein
VTGTAVGFIALVALVIGGWLPPHYLVFGGAVTAWVEFNHIGNLRRLLAGTEPKLGQGGQARSASGR